MLSGQSRGPARPNGSEVGGAGCDVRGTAVDVVAAGVLGYLATYATLDPPGPAFAGSAWVAWLAGAAVGLPLVVRRRWPLPVLTGVTVAAAAATAFGVVGTGVIWVTWAPVVLAIYTTATVASPVTATVVLAGALTAPTATVGWLYHRTGITPADAPGSEAPLWWQVEVGMIAVLVTAAWATGRVVRWRRNVQADLARRMARDAVAAERLRIARELHDIVGHSMSLIAVKATVANHVTTRRPADPGADSETDRAALETTRAALETSRAALEVIERTSRTALTEIRRLLDVLRSETDPAGTDVEFGPSPGTADLPDIANRLRSAGLRVELRMDGTDDLPQAVDLTVFRIVQEALTNVVKHADADRCQVTVRGRGEDVHIEVLDNGRAHRSSGRRSGGPDHAGQGHRTGQGLIGMRERVTVYGGTLTARPRPEGGFLVVADIPYATATQEKDG